MDTLKAIFFGGDAQSASVFTSGEFEEGSVKEKRTPEERAAFRSKVIGGGLLAGSASGDIIEGFRESARLKTEGRAFDFQARQASLRGAALAINESIRATEAIGSQIVATPTSLTGSSAGTVVSEFENTQTNINIIRLNAEQRAALLRDAASKARKQASFAKIAGFVKAGKRVGTAFAGGV